ncbi:hypothetical protein HPB50_027645 [Hyalomma asiaticum]|nr:hypothetical protein HPB50_027645 [Hyalomma asiaticum]
MVPIQETKVGGEEATERMVLRFTTRYCPVVGHAAGSSAGCVLFVKKLPGLTVVATIFGTEAAEYESVLTDPSHDWKDLHGIEIPLRGHRCLIEEAVLSLVPTHAPTSVTSAASDLPMAIRSYVPPSNFSGPGSGTLGEMLTKPFVFVVQPPGLSMNVAIISASTTDSTTMISTSTTHATATVSSVDINLHPFMTADPVFWFIQVEAQFT